MATYLCCGDRNWTDYETILNKLKELKVGPGDRIVQGCCRGADKLARTAAIELRASIKDYPANWSEHGRAAGPIRNRQMLSEKPDMVIAFHNDIESSKGTKNMIQQATKAGIDVVLVKG